MKYSSLNTLLLLFVRPDIRFSTFNRGWNESAKKQNEEEDEVIGHHRPQPGCNSRRSITIGGSYRHSPQKPVSCCKLCDRCLRKMLQGVRYIMPCIRPAVAKGIVGTIWNRLRIHRCCTNMFRTWWHRIAGTWASTAEPYRNHITSYTRFITLSFRIIFVCLLYGNI